MAEEQAESIVNPVELATELTIAWLGNPNVRATAEEVPAFLRSMHATIGALSKGSDTAPADVTPEYTPAVPVRSSVRPDYLISLIDGRKLKSLKRHLSSHGLTPAEYRERYGLKSDYPMVAASYSAQRREVAQKLGLGRKGRAAQAVAPESAPVAEPQSAPAKPVDKPARRGAAKPKSAPKVAPKTAASKRGRAKKTDTPAA